MELELKHIAPYLSHKLKVKYLDGDCTAILPVYGLKKDGHNNAYWLGLSGEISYPLVSHKPLLIPLEEITQSHIDNSPYFTKTEFIESVLNETCPTHIWLNLVENHFDVHALIENGLALNKLDHA